MEYKKDYNKGDIVIANKSYVHTDSVIREALRKGSTGVVKRITNEKPYYIEVKWEDKPNDYPCKPEELEPAFKLIHPLLK